MKKILLTILLFLFSVSPASAHVLKIDGSVGAVIHVSPEDDPIAGEATDFFFEFKDKENKFKPDNCDCRGVIIQGGKEVYSAPLFQSSANPSLENASFSFTFPEKDIYKVRVSGKPTTPGAFNPFTLEWDLRVARESDNIQTSGGTPNTISGEANQNPVIDWVSNHIPHIIGVFLILIFVIFYFLKRRSKNVKE